MSKYDDLGFVPDAPKDNSDIGFVPDSQKQAANVSIGEAALQGVNKGLSFGWQDEFIGALRATAEKIQGSKTPWKDLYEGHRDSLREWSKQASASHPVAFGIGEFAGAAGTLAVPGARVLAPAKSASTAMNIGKAAALGAVQGAGESEAAGGDFKTLAKDIATGAALAGGFQGGIMAAGKGLSKLAPSNLRKLSEERAVKAATGQNIKEIRALEQTKQMGKTGQDLMSKDEAGSAVVKLFSRAEDIAPAAEAKAKYFGSKIGEVAEEIDALVPNAVDGKSIAKRIMGFRSSLVPEAANPSVLKNLEKVARSFSKRGEMGFADAQRLKNAFKFKVTDPTTQHLGQDATNFIKGAIGDEMDVAARRAKDQIGDSLAEARDLIDKYELFKRKYGSFATAARAAKERVAKNQSNRFVSPSDYAAGATGFIPTLILTGGEPTSAAGIAAASAFANKLARERGSAFMARTMNALANTLEKSPETANYLAEKLGDTVYRGPGALLLSHIVLSATDPQYAGLIEKKQTTGLGLPGQRRGLMLPAK